MKAIILVSSIFYLLGLKISHTFDLVKPRSSVEKIVIQKAVPSKPVKAADYSKEIAKPATDSVCGGCNGGNQILENE